MFCETDELQQMLSSSYYSFSDFLQAIFLTAFAMFKLHMHHLKNGEKK